MKRSLPFVLVIAAILAAVALFVSREAVDETTKASPYEPTFEAPARPPEFTAPDEAADAASADSPTRALAEPTASVDAPAPSTVALVVIVTAPTGAPHEGAHVTVTEAPDRGFSFLDPGFGSRRTRVGEASTDSEGRATFLVSAAQVLDLQIVAEGFATCRRRGVRGDAVVRVELERDAVITGRVLDAASNEPLADARVELRPGRAAIEPWRGRPDETVTGVDGWFRFEGVTPGSVEIAATHPRFSMGWPMEIEARTGDRIVRDLLLDAGFAVSGTVRDAATGEPIADAVLSVDPLRSHLDTVHTDATGRFVYPFFPRYAPQLTAHAAGYASQQKVVRARRDDDPATTLEFALVRDRRARGVVVDHAGNPLAAVYVAAAATDYGGEHESQRIDWHSTMTGEDGAFEIAGIHPDLSPTLVLRREGFATSLFDFPTSDGSVVEFGTIALLPGVTVEIEVTDEEDQSREDLRVELIGANSDRRRFAPDAPANALLDSYAAARSARSFGGIATFPDSAVGEYEARAVIPGTHRDAVVAFSVGREARVVRAKLVVPRGLEMRGRVRVDDDGTLPKVYVSIDPMDGQGTSADAECDAEGRFRATGLAAGRYRLSLYPYASDADRRAGRSFESVVRENVILGLEEVELVVPSKR